MREKIRLQAHPAVSWVSYAGLRESPYHELAHKYLGGRAGSVFTFGLKGGYDAGVRLVSSVKSGGMGDDKLALRACLRPSRWRSSHSTMRARALPANCAAHGEPTMSLMPRSLGALGDAAPLL